MENRVLRKVIQVLLFTLVPAAYLSMGHWRPADAYEKGVGRVGVSPICTALMAAVFLICLISWNRDRLMAFLGLLACFLWMLITMLPVL